VPCGDGIPPCDVVTRKRNWRSSETWIGPQTGVEIRIRTDTERYPGAKLVLDSESTPSLPGLTVGPVDGDNLENEHAPGPPDPDDEVVLAGVSWHEDVDRRRVPIAGRDPHGS